MRMFEMVTASSVTENVRQNVRQHDYYLKLQPWCLAHFVREMGHFHWSRLGCGVSRHMYRMFHDMLITWMIQL